jgi:hypothetical protein
MGEKAGSFSAAADAPTFGCDVEAIMPWRVKALSKVRKRQDQGSPLCSHEPAVNPMSIEAALLQFLRPLSPEGGQDRIRKAVLESEIESHMATPALERLIDAGCDRDALLRALGVSCGKPVCFTLDGWFTKPGPLSIRNLYGLGSRDFTRLKVLLRQSAKAIAEINRTRAEFGILLTTPHLKMFWGIPNLLWGYVSLLDLAAERLAGGAHYYRNLGKGILTLHVKQRAHRSHDKEVSSLLSAVCNLDGYDANSHRTWKREHKELLDRLSPLVALITIPISLEK